MRKNRFILLLALPLLLAGCAQNNDDIGGNPANEAVRFTATIETATATRTTYNGDRWLQGDKVGIFMLKHGGNLGTPADVLADNMQYMVESTTGELSGTPIYYPMAAAVDFTAYYPYEESPNGVLTINIEEQTTTEQQNVLDKLYARADNNGSGYAKSSAPVTLTFNHILSKVTFNVALGNGFSGFSGADIADVSLSGMPVEATFNLQNLSLSPGASAVLPVLKTAGSALTATFVALIVPQPNGGTERMASFNVGGRNFLWRIPNSEKFAAGYHYTYPVGVNHEGIVVGLPTIARWTMNDQGSSLVEIVN